MSKLCALCTEWRPERDAMRRSARGEAWGIGCREAMFDGARSDGEVAETGSLSAEGSVIRWTIYKPTVRKAAIEAARTPHNATTFRRCGGRHVGAIPRQRISFLMSSSNPCGACACCSLRKRVCTLFSQSVFIVRSPFVFVR